MDNPANVRPENPSEESPVIENIEPPAQNQDTENMEVHHHSHHGEKKNWKAYFWEFLMLFFAVFCGFLAEWKLEHVIEHSREKEFMESMLIDLKADSSTLANMRSSFGIVGAHIDSLIPLLTNPGELDKRATEIYQHQVYLNRFTKWIYADRTIDQLKNSGNFRLIRNKAVSNGISTYDGFIRNFIDDMQRNLIQRQVADISDLGNNIFKSSVFREYFKSGRFSYHAVKLPDAPYFLTNEKFTLQKFINKLDQYAVSIDWFSVNINKALIQNMTLDSLIRREYNLKLSE